MFIPDRKPEADLNENTTKGQVGEPMSLIGVTCRNISEGLLSGIEMTQTAASDFLLLIFLMIAILTDGCEATDKDLANM